MMSMDCVNLAHSLVPNIQSSAWNIHPKRLSSESMIEQMKRGRNFLL